MTAVWISEFLEIPKIASYIKFEYLEFNLKLDFQSLERTY